MALFQKLPLAGLQTNPINRSLSVDGGEPVITINGVPSNIDEFNAIQPRNILKIEYSRFTPARYADTGKTGLINVILKKRNDGGEISAYGRTALSTTLVDGNILASYHQGPSKFSFQYVPSWRNYQKVYDYTTSNYIGDDFRVNLDETDRNPFYYHQHAVTLQYDLSIDEHTLFSTSFSITPFFRKARFQGHTIDSELGEYDSNNLTSSRVLTPSLDIFVHKDFNDKNSVEVQVVGTLSSNDYRRDNNFIFADDNISSYIMNVDSRRRSLISEISYNHNFSSATSLSAGYQNTVSRSTNTYLSSDYKPVLTENNNYAYVRLDQRFGAVHISLSTGAKLFWIKNDLNRRHFIRNLSSAQISWNVNKEWSIVGNFRYSPSIPSLTSLTDYPQQTTPYLVSNGNPDLKVDENFNYAVSVNYVNRLFKASYQSSYFNGRNSVTSDVTYLGDRLFLSRPINSRYNSGFKNSLDLGLNDFHGFGVNLSFKITRYESAGSGWKHSLTSLGGTAYVWWNKGPYTIGYWRTLPDKYLSGHYVGKQENGDALELQWMPDKHWSFEVDWMYMFDKKGTRYPSWNYSSVNPSSSTRYIKNNSNMVVLSVKYTADFGSIFRSTRRNLNNSDSGSSLLQL